MNLKKINHEQLKELIEVCYNSKSQDNRKTAIMVYGTYGIGKSAIIKQKAEQIATSKNKKFIEWNRTTEEEKEKVFNNPKDYFVLIDIRLSEYDSSDIKGLPDFSCDVEGIRKWLIWKVPFFEKLLEQKDSDGILFFDEINLATPLVISSCYKIIYDRVVNDGEIADDWLIISAGNNEEDRAFTHDLATPVRDRCIECELSSNYTEWEKWAIESKINSKIIGFLNFKPSNLHNVNYESGQKPTTERGWERVSNLMVNNEDNLKRMELIVPTAIGEGIAREFLAYCKIAKNINIDDIINNPKELEKVTEISIKYFVVSALAERFGDKKFKFETLLEISEMLDSLNNPEFVTLLWRLSIKYSPTAFTKGLQEATKNKNKIIGKYSRFLD